MSVNPATVPVGRISRRRPDWETRASTVIRAGVLLVQYRDVGHGQTRGLVEGQPHTLEAVKANPEAERLLIDQMDEAVNHMPKAIVRDYSHLLPVTAPRLLREKSQHELARLMLSMSTLTALLNGTTLPLRPDQAVEFSKKYVDLQQQMRDLREQWQRVEGHWEVLGRKFVDVMGSEGDD